jgi:hypothetical protein
VRLHSPPLLCLMGLSLGITVAIQRAETLPSTLSTALVRLHSSRGNLAGHPRPWLYKLTATPLLLRTTCDPSTAKSRSSSSSGSNRMGIICLPARPSGPRSCDSSGTAFQAAPISRPSGAALAAQCTAFEGRMRSGLRRRRHYRCLDSRQARHFPFPASLCTRAQRRKASAAPRMARGSK